MKKVPAKNKGLKKLPKAVRNKMGFMKNGGKVKKKKGYKAGGKVKKGYKLGGAIKAIKAKPKKMMNGGAMRKKGYKAGGKVTPKKRSFEEKSLNNNYEMTFENLQRYLFSIKNG